MDFDCQRAKRRLIKRNDFGSDYRGAELPLFCMKRAQPSDDKQTSQRVFYLENSGEIDSTCKKIKTEKDLSLLIQDFSRLDPSAISDPNIPTQNAPNQDAIFPDKNRVKALENDAQNIFVLKEVSQSFMRKIARSQRSEAVKQSRVANNIINSDSQKLYLIGEDGRAVKVDRSEVDDSSYAFYDIRILDRRKIETVQGQGQSDGMESESQDVDFLKKNFGSASLRLQMNDELGDLLVKKSYFDYYDPYEQDAYHESVSESEDSEDSNHAENSKNDYPHTPSSSDKE